MPQARRGVVRHSGRYQAYATIVNHNSKIVLNYFNTVILENKITSEGEGYVSLKLGRWIKFVNRCPKFTKLVEPQIGNKLNLQFYSTIHCYSLCGSTQNFTISCLTVAQWARGSINTSKCNVCDPFN